MKKSTSKRKKIKNLTQSLTQKNSTRQKRNLKGNKMVSKIAYKRILGNLTLEEMDHKM